MNKNEYVNTVLIHVLIKKFVLRITNIIIQEILRLVK